MKVISFAGITCDLETEMLMLTDNVFEKSIWKYLKKSNTLGKHSNTNTFNS